METHIAQCLSCQSEFELERMTKGIVRAKISIQKVPVSLQSRILQELEKQSIARETVGDKVRRAFRSVASGLRQRGLRPAYLLGAAVIVGVVAFLLFLRREPVAPRGELEASDLVEQAVFHYSSYMNGAMPLQYISSDRTELQNYFQQKVTFDVYMPKMAEARLIGGFLCEHTGGKFVNFIYKADDKVVFFSVACSKEMKTKGKFRLSAQAETDLNRTGWHFDTSRTACNVALWKENDEVCSVVADMKKEELLALLKDDEQ